MVIGINRDLERKILEDAKKEAVEKFKNNINLKEIKDVNILGIDLVEYNQRLRSGVLKGKFSINKKVNITFKLKILLIDEDDIGYSLIGKSKLDLNYESVELLKGEVFESYPISEDKFKDLLKLELKNREYINNKDKSNELVEIKKKLNEQLKNYQNKNKMIKIHQNIKQYLLENKDKYSKKESSNNSLIFEFNDRNNLNYLVYPQACYLIIRDKNIIIKIIRVYNILDGKSRDETIMYIRGLKINDDLESIYRCTFLR